MKAFLCYPVGSTDACRYASRFLQQAGIKMIDHPSPEVSHLLLDVPSFDGEGNLRGGDRLETVLAMLPQDMIVIGGNLNHPALSGYETIDLLQDPEYLAVNAAITADCALRIAAPKIPLVFSGCPVLIIGWGRIGKSLGQLLRSIGADVTIAARKETDRSLLKALHFQAIDTAELKAHLSKFRLIFNTAPEFILSESDLSVCKECLKIDLASKLGLNGPDVIWARGLPGLHTPESSGKLIAGTILRKIGGKG